MSIIRNPKQSRERVLLVTLAILVATSLALYTSHVLPSGDEPSAASNPRAELERREEIQRRSHEIETTLTARKAMWDSVRSGMLNRESPAVLIATLSETLSDLADDSGVDVGQPNITLDSVAVPRRVHARMSVHGEPDAIVFFLDTLTRHPQHVWTRALQMARSPASTSTSLTWSGTLDVESLVQPPRP